MGKRQIQMTNQIVIRLVRHSAHTQYIVYSINILFINKSSSVVVVAPPEAARNRVCVQRKRDIFAKNHSNTYSNESENFSKIVYFWNALVWSCVNLFSNERYLKKKYNKLCSIVLLWRREVKEDRLNNIVIYFYCLLFSHLRLTHVVSDIPLFSLLICCMVFSQEE